MDKKKTGIIIIMLFIAEILISVTRGMLFKSLDPEEGLD